MDWLSNLLPRHPAIIGATVAATVAVILFVMRDILWQGRHDRGATTRARLERRLADLYSPLYNYYYTGYCRFDAWKLENTQSVLSRRPFFIDDEVLYVSDLLNRHSDLASPELAAGLSSFCALSSPAARNENRETIVKLIIHEYHRIRKDLGLTDHSSLAESELFLPSPSASDTV